jgi:hypothetical protein
MKSLPTFTISAAATLLAAWGIGVGDWGRLPLQADDGAQEASQTEVASNGDKTPRGETDAEAALKVLQDARYRLVYERRSVQATLRETVSMGARRFRGEGTYIAGPYPKLRLELSLDVGGTRGQLLEVCDGTILWTVQQIATPNSAAPEVQVARTVISDVTEALESTMDVPETFLIAGLGVGGLPALLASLERSMTFEAMRELEEEGRKFTVIQGRWSDEYLDRLTGGQEDVQLPAYMPDHVRIYFDNQTQFPTRILYLRRSEPGASTFVPLLSFEFSDVVLDGPVDDELFLYTPGPDVKVRDRTGEYLKLIGEMAEKGRRDAAVRPDGSVPAGEK